MQVATAMIFNGHTPESVANLDDITMAQIQTMYADGAIGNNNIVALLGTLINGLFNYIRPPSAPTYKLSSIIGNGYDYIYLPVTKEQLKAQTNESLLAFMVSAPGFDKERFNGK